MEMTPTVEIVYIHVLNIRKFSDYAIRFVESYRQFPPGHPHSTTIICNCGAPAPITHRIFQNMPDAQLMPWTNEGQDIGGYLYAAKYSKADMIVCLGSNVHFHRADWLKRMVEAWTKYGPGLYGSFATYYIRPHINTSGFWCSPSLLLSYPNRVVIRADRYGFEHGPENFARLTFRRGLPVKLVTWDGEYDWTHWRKAPNIYHRGNQSNCLLYWRITDHFRSTTSVGRYNLSRAADNLTEPLP